MLKQSGFTLLELMMVTVILGILVSIAAPLYMENSVESGRKTDCIEPLIEIATQMELLKAASPTHVYPANGSLSAAGVPYDDSAGDYTYIISNSTANSFTLTCDIVAGKDPSCGSLTYDNFGRKGVSAGTVDECWR